MHFLFRTLFGRVVLALVAGVLLGLFAPHWAVQLLSLIHI